VLRERFQDVTVPPFGSNGTAYSPAPILAQEDVLQFPAILSASNFYISAYVLSHVQLKRISSVILIELKLLQTINDKSQQQRISAGKIALW
jgi:hypothetical protein